MFSKGVIYKWSWQKEQHITCMLSVVGVRNEILTELVPSKPITWPLYQRPSVWRNLHFDPIEQSWGESSDSSGSGSTWVGSSGSTLASSNREFDSCFNKIASASFNNRDRFRWSNPSSASLIATNSSLWTFRKREGWQIKTL